jgi:hypothetical protein
MAIFLFLIGYFKLTQNYISLFVAINLFIAAFQLSTGSVAWLYVSETTVDQASGFVMSG